MAKPKFASSLKQITCLLITILGLSGLNTSWLFPKGTLGSLLTIETQDAPLLLELLTVIREVATKVVAEHGACRVLTNLGEYQDSKHLHWHICFGEPL